MSRSEEKSQKPGKEFSRKACLSEATRSMLEAVCNDFQNIGVPDSTEKSGNISIFSDEEDERCEETMETTNAGISSEADTAVSKSVSSVEQQCSVTVPSEEDVGGDISGEVVEKDKENVLQCNSHSSFNVTDASESSQMEFVSDEICKIIDGNSAGLNRINLLTISAEIIEKNAPSNSSSSTSVADAPVDKVSKNVNSISASALNSVTSKSRSKLPPITAIVNQPRMPVKMGDINPERTKQLQQNRNMTANKNSAILKMSQSSKPARRVLPLPPRAERYSDTRSSLKARRISAKMKQAWALQLQKDGHLTCPVPGCSQSYVTVANLITHYKWCSGKKSLQHCIYCSSLIIADHSAVLHHIKVEHPEKLEEYKEKSSVKHLVERQGDSQINDFAAQQELPSSKPYLNQTSGNCVAKTLSKKYQRLNKYSKVKLRAKENILKPRKTCLKRKENLVEEEEEEEPCDKKCVRFNDIVEKIKSVEDKPVEQDTTAVCSTLFHGIPESAFLPEEIADDILDITECADLPPTNYFDLSDEENIDDSSQSSNASVVTPKRVNRFKVLDTHGYKRFSEYLKLTRDWASERKTYSRSKHNSCVDSCAVPQTAATVEDVADVHQLHDKPEPSKISLGTTDTELVQNEITPYCTAAHEEPDKNSPIFDNLVSCLSDKGREKRQSVSAVKFTRQEFSANTLHPEKQSEISSAEERVNTSQNNGNSPCTAPDVNSNNVYKSSVTPKSYRPLVKLRVTCYDNACKEDVKNASHNAEKAKTVNSKSPITLDKTVANLCKSLQAPLPVPDFDSLIKNCIPSTSDLTHSCQPTPKKKRGRPPKNIAQSLSLEKQLVGSVSTDSTKFFDSVTNQAVADGVKKAFIRENGIKLPPGNTVVDGVVKRKRGRPRKNPLSEQCIGSDDVRKARVSKPENISTSSRKIVHKCKWCVDSDTEYARALKRKRNSAKVLPNIESFSAEQLATLSALSKEELVASGHSAVIKYIKTKKKVICTKKVKCKEAKLQKMARRPRRPKYGVYHAQKVDASTQVSQDIDLCENTVIASREGSTQTALLEHSVNESTPESTDGSIGNQTNASNSNSILMHQNKAESINVNCYAGEKQLSNDSSTVTTPRKRGRPRKSLALVESPSHASKNASNGDLEASTVSNFDVQQRTIISDIAPGLLVAEGQAVTNSTSACKDSIITQSSQITPKRGRGRPRKNPLPTESIILANKSVNKNSVLSDDAAAVSHEVQEKIQSELLSGGVLPSDKESVGDNHSVTDTLNLISKQRLETSDKGSKAAVGSLQVCDPESTDTEIVSTQLDSGVVEKNMGPSDAVLVPTTLNMEVRNKTTKTSLSDNLEKICVDTINEVARDDSISENGNNSIAVLPSLEENCNVEEEQHINQMKKSHITEVTSLDDMVSTDLSCIASNVDEMEKTVTSVNCMSCESNNNVSLIIGSDSNEKLNNVTRTDNVSTNKSTVATPVSSDLNILVANVTVGDSISSDLKNSLDVAVSSDSIDVANVSMASKDNVLTNLDTITPIGASSDSEINRAVEENYLVSLNSSSPVSTQAIGSDLCEETNINLNTDAASVSVSNTCGLEGSPQEKSTHYSLETIQVTDSLTTKPKEHTSDMLIPESSGEVKTQCNQEAVQCMDSPNNISESAASAKISPELSSSASVTCVETNENISSETLIIDSCVKETNKINTPDTGSAINQSDSEKICPEDSNMTLNDSLSQQESHTSKNTENVLEVNNSINSSASVDSPSADSSKGLPKKIGRRGRPRKYPPENKDLTVGKHSISSATLKIKSSKELLLKTPVRTSSRQRSSRKLCIDDTCLHECHKGFHTPSGKWNVTESELASKAKCKQPSENEGDVLCSHGGVSVEVLKSSDKSSRNIDVSSTSTIEVNGNAVNVKKSDGHASDLCMPEEAEVMPSVGLGAVQISNESHMPTSNSFFNEKTMKSDVQKIVRRRGRPRKRPVNVAKENSSTSRINVNDMKNCEMQYTNVTGDRSYAGSSPRKCSRKGLPRKCVRYAVINSGVDSDTLEDESLGLKSAQEEDKRTRKKVRVDKSKSDSSEIVHNEAESKDQPVVKKSIAPALEKPCGDISSINIEKQIAEENVHSEEVGLNVQKEFRSLTESELNIKSKSIKEHLSKVKPKGKKRKRNLQRSLPEDIEKEKPSNNSQSKLGKCVESNLDQEDDMHENDAKQLPPCKKRKITRMAAVKARKMMENFLDVEDKNENNAWIPKARSLKKDDDYQAELEEKSENESDVELPDSSEDDVELELARYKDCYLAPEKSVREVSAELLAEWGELLASGKKVVCENKECGKFFKSKMGMKEHYANSVCQTRWKCLICNKSMKHSGPRAMLRHLRSKHKLDEEKAERGNEPELNASQKKTVHSPAKRSYLPYDFSTLQLTLDFYKKHTYSDLMPECKPKTNLWKLQDSGEYEAYLPPLKTSIKIGMEYGGNSQEKWFNLNCFETAPLDAASSHCTFFVGGPIWSAAWCPTPLEVHAEQFIALATANTMDSDHPTMPASEGKGLLQLWSLGMLGKNITDCKPSLCLAIAHNHGTVWDMAWCPTGCWEDPSKCTSDVLPRLGLLAIACSDSSVYIYSIPHPSMLSYGANSLPVFRVDPSLILLCDYGEPCLVYRKSMCTSVTWQRTDGCELIASGFSNGTICVWQVTSETPLLVNCNNNRKTMLPFLSFQAHSAAVTGVVFAGQQGGRWLTSCAFDRVSKVWDLEDTSLPVSSVQKKLVRSVQWMTHWNGIFITKDDTSNATIYKECGYYSYTPRLLVPHNASIWSCSVSEWLNTAVSCDAAGEVAGCILCQLLKNVDSIKQLHDRRFPVFRTELRSVRGDRSIPVPRTEEEICMNGSPDQFSPKHSEQNGVNSNQNSLDLSICSSVINDATTIVQTVGDILQSVVQYDDNLEINVLDTASCQENEVPLHNMLKSPSVEILMDESPGHASVKCSKPDNANEMDIMSVSTDIVNDAAVIIETMENVLISIVQKFNSGANNCDDVDHLTGKITTGKRLHTGSSEFSEQNYTNMSDITSVSTDVINQTIAIVETMEEVLRKVHQSSEIIFEDSSSYENTKLDFDSKPKSDHMNNSVDQCCSVAISVGEGADFASSQCNKQSGVNTVDLTAVSVNVINKAVAVVETLEDVLGNVQLSAEMIQKTSPLYCENKVYSGELKASVASATFEENIGQVPTACSKQTSVSTVQNSVEASTVSAVLIDEATSIVQLMGDILTKVQHDQSSRNIKTAASGVKRGTSEVTEDCKNVLDNICSIIENNYKSTGSNRLDPMAITSGHGKKNSIFSGNLVASTNLIFSADIIEVVEEIVNTVATNDISDISIGSCELNYSTSESSEIDRGTTSKMPSDFQSRNVSKNVHLLRSEAEGPQQNFSSLSTCNKHIGESLAASERNFCVAAEILNDLVKKIENLSSNTISNDSIENSQVECINLASALNTDLNIVVSSVINSILTTIENMQFGCEQDNVNKSIHVVKQATQPGFKQPENLAVSPDTSLQVKLGQPNSLGGEHIKEKIHMMYDNQLLSDDTKLCTTAVHSEGATVEESEMDLDILSPEGSGRSTCSDDQNSCISMDDACSELGSIDFIVVDEASCELTDDDSGLEGGTNNVICYGDFKDTDISEDVIVQGDNEVNCLNPGSHNLETDVASNQFSDVEMICSESLHSSEGNKVKCIENTKSNLICGKKDDKYSNHTEGDIIQILDECSDSILKTSMYDQGSDMETGSNEKPSLRSEENEANQKLYGYSNMETTCIQEPSLRCEENSTKLKVNEKCLYKDSRATDLDGNFLEKHQHPDDNQVQVSGPSSENMKHTMQEPSTLIGTCATVSSASKCIKEIVEGIVSHVVEGKSYKNVPKNISGVCIETNIDDAQLQENRTVKRSEATMLCIMKTAESIFSLTPDSQPVTFKEVLQPLDSVHKTHVCSVESCEGTDTVNSASEIPGSGENVLYVTETQTELASDVHKRLCSFEADVSNIPPSKKNKIVHPDEQQSVLYERGVENQNMLLLERTTVDDPLLEGEANVKEPLTVKNSAHHKVLPSSGSSEVCAEREIDVQSKNFSQNSGSSERTRNLNPLGNYASVAQDFGLFYRDANLSNFVNLPESEKRRLKKSETMTPAIPDKFQLTSVNTVKWNTNYGSHLWLFTGGQAGIARLSLVKALDSNVVKTCTKSNKKSHQKR